MKIVITKKLGQFVDASRRMLQPDSVEWVGMVESDGLVGALAIDRATGECRLHNKGGSRRLDAGEVERNMPPSIGPGRPLSDSGLMRHAMISLTEDQREAAKKLGNGNLSEGIRTAIKICCGIA